MTLRDEALKAMRRSETDLMIRTGEYHVEALDPLERLGAALEGLLDWLTSESYSGAQFLNDTLRHD